MIEIPKDRIKWLLIQTKEPILVLISIGRFVNYATDASLALGIGLLTDTFEMIKGLCRVHAYRSLQASQGIFLDYAD